MLRIVVDTNLWNQSPCHLAAATPRITLCVGHGLDGRVDAIVTGDADLRADDELRTAMEQHGVALWGIDSMVLPGVGCPMICTATRPGVE